MVSWDLINSKNSTLITFGNCAVNVLCQLSVKYYTVKAFIFKSYLSIELKNHSHQGLEVSLSIVVPFCVSGTINVSEQKLHLLSTNKRRHQYCTYVKGRQLLKAECTFLNMCKFLQLS